MNSATNSDVPATTRHGGTLKLALSSVVLLFAIGGISYWWCDARYFEATDNAYVKADTAIISTKISGYVAAIHAQENHVVHAGETLVEIDDRDYRFAADQERANVETQNAALQTLQEELELQKSIVAQTQASLGAAQADAHLKVLDYNRDQHLLATGYVSRQRLDTDSATVETAQAEIVKAQATVQAAQAQVAVLHARQREARSQLAKAKTGVDIAALNLNHTVIVAPFDGVLANRAVAIGDYVRPGVQLFTLIPLNQNYVIANFKETQLQRLRQGQSVAIAIDAYPKRILAGKIESLAPATGSEFSLLPPENATGNFTKIVQRVPVKIVFSAENDLTDRVRPGLSVIVKVDTRNVGNGDRKPLVSLASVFAR